MISLEKIDINKNKKIHRMLKSTKIMNIIKNKAIGNCTNFTILEIKIVYFLYSRIGRFL